MSERNSVRKAYMQGQNDPEYEEIIRAISAITFLATPHRGTNLADILNRILQSTVVANSKHYISELARTSFTLQKLNEQFRHIAPRLDIVSFYETQPTLIGRTAKIVSLLLGLIRESANALKMVLEKDSSVLGYPGETSRALTADHHDVCKYESRRDPNYITVRNALKSLVSKIISTGGSNRQHASNRRSSLDLKSLLAITELPDVDYILFRDQWSQGTGAWILEDEAYLEWVDAQGPTPRLLWLNGGPGTGKSVLSSFIISSLVERSFSCQYFFIRFGDRKKRTLNFLLRSIAYQTTQSLPMFSQRITELVDEAINYETADPRTIWERIFKGILFKMNLDKPLYWIIDGLDEASDPREIFRLLSDPSLSFAPIRVLLVSRKSSEIETAYQKVSKFVTSRSMGIEGHLEDQRSYIWQELDMAGSPEVREDVVRRVLERSHNNFLVGSRDFHALSANSVASG